MIIFGYKIHAILGFISALPFGNVTGVFFAIIGSLLPDIDHSKSVLGRLNPLNWIGLMCHRGKCHTIMGCLLLSSPFSVFGYPALFVFIGALSHLLADRFLAFFTCSGFKIKMWMIY